MRHHLGITAFGTNAYVGRSAGDLVIEDHDEDEHEELYVVLSGAATFTVDGETFDAPAGHARPRHAAVTARRPRRRAGHDHPRGRRARRGLQRLRVGDALADSGSG